MAGHLEHLVDLLGEDAFTRKAFTPIRIVQLAAADGADAIEHLFFAIREMPREPVIEKILLLVGQAEDDVAGVSCSGF